MSLVIGRFEIVREIGKSELGTVYKAYDPKKKRTVALRVLRADTPQAMEQSRQYLLRAKAVSVLDSPNIASVYAGAEEQGLVYVVMEYVEGVPLDAALATQQGFSSNELLDISRQVCRGLDHAHSKSIFHRRLTPPGILTEWDGTVKIMDFAAEPGSLDGQAGDELRYMSPEQVQGRAPDARSNVFNWGAILYEMVTGRRAFGDGDGAAVEREVLEIMPPAPEEIIPRLPAGIGRVIMKALAKNPEYRFQRAAELVSELETEVEAAGRPSIPGVAHVKPPAPQPPQPRPRLTLPRAENPPAAAPELVQFHDNVASSHSATRNAPSLSSPAAPSLRSEPLLGYSVPEPAAPSWTQPPAAAPSDVHAPAAVERETVAPAPPQPAPARMPGSLSPQQIRILAGVIGAALIVMVIVMVIDGVRAKRLREEAEAAAAAPLLGNKAPDPFSSASPRPLPEPEPPRPVVQMVAPSRTVRTRRKAVVVQAAALPNGQLAISSYPDGAQVQVDGSVAGVTPLALNNVNPGQHLVVVAKPGYAAESRSVMVQRASRSAVAVSLNQLAAVAAVSSDPPGANIIIDGRDTGKVTPAKFSVGPGGHSLSLRKPGYLETSAAMTVNPGETFQFQPTLKALGNADDIRQVGRFKKLLGHGGTEDMARVQVRTFPKGAQIMFNSRMMDRASPAEFLLGAGTYEVTITLTGYKTIHKTVTVESNGRMEINETLER